MEFPTFREYLSDKNVVSQEIIEESINSTLVEEAAFKSADKVKVLDKVKKIIEKATGKKYALSPMPFFYKNKSGSHTGFYMWAKDKSAIRFNLDETKSKLNIKKTSGFEITSFDVYSAEDAKANKGKGHLKPTVTVNLNGLNIVQVISKLTDVLKNPEKNKKFTITVDLPNPYPKKPLPVKVVEEAKVLDINLIEEANVQNGIFKRRNQKIRYRRFSCTNITSSKKYTRICGY
jgi:hypothetical protein